MNSYDNQIDDTNRLAQLVAALNEGDISDSGYASLLVLATKYPAEFKAWMVRS